MCTARKPSTRSKRKSKSKSSSHPHGGIASKYKASTPKAVKEPVKYNQKYWADHRAKGVSQADMKKQQDAIGIKKAYSGDKVVTKDQQKRAADDLKRLTGSMATLQNGGVTKSTKKSGLFGEKFETTYDYKGGPKVVLKGSDPKVGSVRLGKRKSTTYVDGVEVATKTGNDPVGRDAVITKPKVAGRIDDKVKVAEKPKTVTEPSASAPKQTTASGSPAGSTVQPDNLKNVLAISKNKRKKGKRGLRNKTSGGISFGSGGSGLNIPT